MISRARAGHSNLYRLHKVALNEKISAITQPASANPLAENCHPGMQKIAGGGRQYIADESYALEEHTIKNNHTDNTEPQELHLPSPALKGGSDQDQTCVSVNTNKENEVQGQEFLQCSISTVQNQPPPPLQAGPVPGGTSHERIAAALTAYGVSKLRARQLAPSVVAANLDDKYIRELVEWINNQTALRKVYNPAGFLVQLVPVPPATVNPDFNSLKQSKLESEIKLDQEFATKHLPRLNCH